MPPAVLAEVLDRQAQAPRARGPEHQPVGPRGKVSSFERVAEDLVVGLEVVVVHPALGHAGRATRLEDVPGLVGESLGHPAPHGPAAQPLVLEVAQDLQIVVAADLLARVEVPVRLRLLEPERAAGLAGRSARPTVSRTCSSSRSRARSICVIAGLELLCLAASPASAPRRSGYFRLGDREQLGAARDVDHAVLGHRASCRPRPRGWPRAAASSPCRARARQGRRPRRRCRPCRRPRRSSPRSRRTRRTSSAARPSSGRGSRRSPLRSAMYIRPSTIDALDIVRWNSSPPLCQRYCPVMSPVTCLRA